MTLFIAYILIAGFGLGWPWFLGATAVWFLHLMYHWESSPRKTVVNNHFGLSRGDRPARMTGGRI